MLMIVTMPSVISSLQTLGSEGRAMWCYDWDATLFAGDLIDPEKLKTAHFLLWCLIGCLT
jgi:hypothetical protein